MVSIKNIKDNYYLHHTIRTKNGFKNYDLYLGKSLPLNIEDVKLNFFLDIYKDTLKIIDNYAKKYNKKEKSMPISIKKKELENAGIIFTYNSNKIEGNTLSLKDTFDIIKEDILPEKRPLTDVKETESHYNLFFKLMQKKEKINLNTILSWHYELFKDTKKDIAGKIRNYQVAIAGCKFIPPSPVEIYPELESFFTWYNKNKKKLHPVVFVALIHLKLVTIHPFGDGNGRISRLLMNYVLNKNKYPIFIIKYGNRRAYYNALEKSQVKKDNLYFLQWFLKNYLKDLKKEIK